MTEQLTRDDQRQRHDHSEGGREMQAANLFDLRRIIGGLFVVYGVVLVIIGLQDGTAAIHKAAGVRINLLAGLGMLALGGLFLVWALARPLADQLSEAEAEMQAGSDEALRPEDDARAGARDDRDRFRRDGDVGREQPQHVPTEAAADHPGADGAAPA